MPDLEVVGVVRGRDLHCAGAELGVDVVVGDDRDLPVDERVLQRRADQVAVAIVVGVTATAVSPSIVSTRVVATMTCGSSSFSEP